MIEPRPYSWIVLLFGVWGVVQDPQFLGYTSKRKPPAFEARFRLRRWEAVSLPRSSALRLKGSEAQQRQPMCMALAGHQFPWAFAGATAATTLA